MVIARAYRHTEKLLQDNKDKLALVSSARFKRLFTHDSGCFVILKSQPAAYCLSSWRMRCWSVKC